MQAIATIFVLVLIGWALLVLLSFLVNVAAVIFWIAAGIAAVVGGVYLVAWILEKAQGRAWAAGGAEGLRRTNAGAEDLRRMNEGLREYLSSREHLSRAGPAGLQELVRREDLALAKVRSLLRPCTVIDSNIWMNDSYDSFFEVLGMACEEESYVLTLFGAQFDEITNIKASSDYGSGRNARARRAIDRIEDFQKRGLLSIQSVTINSQRGAYADPLIVELLSDQARDGIPCTFVSDDKELRIRVREHLRTAEEAVWEVIEMEELLPECKHVVWIKTGRWEP